MYYYIVDPPQTKNDQQVINAIRNRLIPEGLTGEFVFRTPGQSASVLADKALKQGFSTLVCVGDDALAGELATVLYDQSAALGIIPIHASGALHDLIGYADWKTAISALRARKIALRDIGVINGELSFLTEVEVLSRKPSLTRIHMNRFAVSAELARLTIKLSSDSPPFDMPGVLNFVVYEPAGLSFLGFGKPKSPIISTLLRAEQAVIQTTAPARILYGKQEIAQTPISVSILPQAIRMIVARQSRATTS